MPYTIQETRSAERELYAALTEKGRVLSADSEKTLRAALASIQAVLAKVMVDDAAATEAALDELPDLAALLTEAELSFSDRERAIRAALKIRNPLGYCWLRDVYDADCIFEMEAGGGYDGTGHLYRVAYTIGADGMATLGDPAEVRIETSYVPVGEAASEAEREIESDLVPLVEKAIGSDGTVPIKLIQPGQGSSGFYSSDVLKRDGPKVFTKGTHMYADHATPAEEAERPEGSIRNLMAVLENDARWEDQGADGPGLYADAKVMPHFADNLEALAPHIGVSIRALGTFEEDGKSVKQLVAAKSVDFVTKAGAGGKVLELFEAARGAAQLAGRVDPPSTERGAEMDETEARTLREAMQGMETQNREMGTQVQRLTEQLILRDGRDVVATVLAEADLPEIVRQRLTDDLIKRIVFKDGALDHAATTTLAREAVQAELAYLAAANPGGKITGLGAATSIQMTEAAQGKLASVLGRLGGLTEAGAQRAAAGR